MFDVVSDFVFLCLLQMTKTSKCLLMSDLIVVGGARWDWAEPLLENVSSKNENIRLVRLDAVT